MLWSGRERMLKDENQEIESTDGSEKKLKAEKQEVFIELDWHMQRKEKKKDTHISMIYLGEEQKES